VVATFVAIATWQTGCAAPHPQAERSKWPGRLILLPGVDGPGWQLQPVADGLRQAGCAGPIDILEWGQRPFGTIPNLTALRANRRAASELAERIQRDAREEPSRPIVLVGFSGGGGMAVFVAEALEGPVRLERLILVSPALSPQYDLRAAIAHCRRGVVSFYSRGDWLIVGAGTRVFGTMDRRFSPSAGNVGFQDAGGGILRLEGLVQIAWQPDWVLKYGHDGGHFGWLSETWAREVLAPQIVSAEADGAKRKGGYPSAVEDRRPQRLDGRQVRVERINEARFLADP